MSIELKTFQLSHGIKPGASVNDQIADLRADQRLRSFSFKAKDLSKSSISVRPIQSGLGIITSLGRLSLASGSAEKEAMGIPSGLNLFSGSLDELAAAKRQKLAEQIGDRPQVFVEGISRWESWFRALGGFAASVSCFSQMKCLADQLSSNSLSGLSLAGKVAGLAGVCDDGAFGGASALEAGLCAYKFYETYRFRKGFDAAEEKAEGLPYLLGCIKINSSAELQRIRSEKKGAMAEFQRDLEKKALDALSEKGLQISADLQLSSSQTRVKFQEYFTELQQIPSLEKQLKASYAACLHVTEEECADFSLAALVGFFVEEKKREHRQQAQITRCTNSEVVEAVQKSANRGLLERLKAGGEIAQTAQKEYQDLSQKVKEATNAKRISQLLKIAEALLSLTICVMTILSVCGVCAAPPLGLFFLLIVLTIALNGRAIKRSLVEGGEGKYDKRYLLLIALVLLISFTASLGIYLHFDLTKIELVKMIVIGCVQIFLVSYAFYALDQREKSWKQTHPDLLYLQEKITALPPGPLTEEVAAVFHRLEKEDQVAIKQAYQDLPFETQRYQQIDSSYSFGSLFLEKNFTSAKEIDLFQRGVEAALEQSWQAYQENKTQQQLEASLQLQTLFEAITRRDKEASIKALNQLYKHAGALCQVIDNVRYLYKLQENQKRLLQAIERVQTSKNKG